jgi:hypothetical protein
MQIARAADGRVGLMGRKGPRPQQQTLSVRISDGMRKRLERARQQTAAASGEAVSTSEIAKQLLESAPDNRLDVADLLEEPTETMVRIRAKGEAQQALSRAEWTVLASFVHIGTEGFAGTTPRPLSPESFAGVVDAFLAVYALRTQPDSSLDLSYLGSFPPECRPAKAKGAGGGDRELSDLVRRTAIETRRRVLDPASPVAPVFVGRAMHRLLGDDKLPGGEDLTRALRPFWSVLWRVAARGHYVNFDTPVRSRATRREGLYQPPIPPVTDERYTLSFTRGEGTEFSVLLGFPGAYGPTYPLSSYPKINEFRAMLEALGPQSRLRRWNGVYFFGYSVTPLDQGPEAYWFRAHDNGITFGFGAKEWATVQRVFQRAWSLPDIRLAWDALLDEYGEL